jgi:hypothetical protein
LGNSPENSWATRPDAEAPACCLPWILLYEIKYFVKTDCRIGAIGDMTRLHKKARRGVAWSIFRTSEIGVCGRKFDKLKTWSFRFNGPMPRHLGPLVYRDANEIPTTPGTKAALEINPRRHGRACPGHPRL